MANILIIDDDKPLCALLSELIQRMGHQTATAYTIGEGLKRATSEQFDVVYLDVGLPDGNGLDTLPQISAVQSRPEIIIMTGKGDPDGAELAIKNNAWDYIEKPSSLHMMRLPLVRALQFREAKSKSDASPPIDRKGIIGSSRQMRESIDLLAKAAQSDAAVLITGETGTGKELFASAIHRNSLRSEKPFVVVDCAGLSETLVESTLFGHEKGAFTGADRARDGLILQANKGTLFLDEIGELPLTLQKNFLRVLQEHTFRPLGSKQELSSDFRLIAATNCNLAAMVASGQFRSDLLYRIAGFSIELPPLRERPEDIRDLTLYHIWKICERYGLEGKGISPDLFEALMIYNWPGNVRELFNTLERTFAVARHEPTLFSRHLPDTIRIQLARAQLKKKNADIPPESDRPFITLQEHRDRGDETYLRQLLASTSNDINEACRTSGMSRSHFYALLKKFGLNQDAH